MVSVLAELEIQEALKRQKEAAEAAAARIREQEVLLMF
jgi:hypothetical protein